MRLELRSMRRHRQTISARTSLEKPPSARLRFAMMPNSAPSASGALSPEMICRSAEKDRENGKWYDLSYVNGLDNCHMQISEP